MNLASFFLNFSEIPFDWSAFFKAFRTIGRSQVDPDRSPIPGKALKEYVRDVIPGLADRAIPTPKAWTCQTDTIPISIFAEQDVVVWNDAAIPRTHGARRGCGEGPFTVHAADDFIVAFRKGSPNVIPPINRLVLESPDGAVIIAHPCYFRKYHG